TTTGCDYHYQLGETLKADQWAAGAEIVCESGKSITISAGGVCEATIGTQALGGTVEVTDNTEASPKKDISIKASLTGIHYTKLKDGFGCPFKGTGEGTSGETSGTFTVTAENPNKSEEKRDLYVAD
ncbi:MAG TPA: hypothetical protein VFI17_03010, partial [Solirubrobacterales bacterium]|nr:hypothetical protein [Solirubrobacterales bacterium]